MARDPLTRLLAPRAELAFTLLRMVAGFMFALHGAQKILGILGSSQPAVGSQMWIGGVIELVAGTAIAVGFLTTWAAFLASGTMAVAYVQFHWKMRFGEKLLPVANGGEMAALYSFLFLYIACRGPGRFHLGKGRR